MTAEELAKKLMELPEERRKQPVLNRDWFEIVGINKGSRWVEIITTQNTGALNEE